MCFQAGQRNTAKRNQRVISAAKRLGYEVVDTFGMTVSRYKDFLMGNCACHFHKVGRVAFLKAFFKHIDLA